ncbi:MAG: hypothetical protein RM368_37240 [Nostoc sp. DedSLP03]|uniref:hypothetical protein n=1 Tax=Nostoc sp. DedSLP03 TaxID=3075400 RepID=UPI002AD47F83|nr:hypothetical protein [Nostoc sp. DedSLP03]MDZ7970512.1 hypothetical protein [Nostoc sp. DedSLP03]
MFLFSEESNLRDDYLWNVRFNQVLLSDKNHDIPRVFTSGTIAVLASTTNINPRNIAGYLIQTVNLFQLGGIAHSSDRYALPNKIPRVIVFENGISPFTLQFRLAFPIGNCTLKIWEAVPKV